MLGRCVVFILLFGLPLLGVMVVGLPLAPYLEFPPTTKPVIYADFSWSAFITVALIPLASVAPFLWRLVSARSTCPREVPCSRRFPWWGRLALVWTMVIWVITWSSLPFLAELRRLSFTPLWLGYIVIVNALLWRRAGYSLLTDHPRYLVQLFVLSAAFWWFFEYLNRFVKNWYYQGIEHYTPLEYFLTATLPFATVLPAVLSTYLLLRTYPRLWWGIESAWSVNFTRPRLWGGITLMLGICGLLGIAILPRLLYPLIWVAPLVLITSIQATVGSATIFRPLVHGDWRPLWLAALAGIICGFFWEMWNWGSLPRWVYAVPGVQRFHLFEMPLLGYAGYLPFGAECLAVTHLYLSTPLPTTRQPILM